MIKKLGLALLGLIVAFWLVLLWLGGGGLGQNWGAGTPNETSIAASTIEQRQGVQEAAADEIGVSRPKQILFGDLHVHSSFSLDAFMMSLPTGGGEGAHPVSDACDFARHCSSLDFWSINDHALSLTSTAWDETIEAMRQCNDIGGGAEDPDVSAFLGWEWTQMGTNPDNHYGHKNVILRGLADEEIPTRPIAAGTPPEAWDRQADGIYPGKLAMGVLALAKPNQDTQDLIAYFDGIVALSKNPCAKDVPVRDLPADCQETAMKPSDLFEKLDDWGFDSLVIPHGTTWGFYTPQNSAWDKQLVGREHDPDRQRLIEVFSGHGNSEEYRTFSSIDVDADGQVTCPEPRDDFLPSCWRAGEIIGARCLAAGIEPAECGERAADARQNYAEAGLFGHLTVPAAKPAEWLDGDQCRDCFQPSFAYRPKSSAQYIMAIRNFDDPEAPRRFDFGFMASSDNHTARPGTGYKEYGRIYNTEARLAGAGREFFGQLLSPREIKADPESVPFEREDAGAFFNLREAERASSYFLTGGLIAVHADSRGRDDIWDAMQRKEVYGTSGPRMLLWFDLLNPPGSHGHGVSMGGQATLDSDPIFQVRAVGSFEQNPGCSDASTSALGEDDIERLCRGECYNPSDVRRVITRIEVVRIRPQVEKGEPVESLIEDPWRVYECDENQDGCAVTFTDPDFSSGGRDALYYVRAIETPSPAVNADGLRCERDDRGRCLSARPCDSGVAKRDDCLAETEERAWSSPIFVEWSLSESL